ncbi:substrate-binding domain-containing protein [Rhodoplanes roseus]|nr:substrate-binding domain-containing protein [Rhodoplanes roseus]
MAPPITCISSMATRHILNELAALCEQRTGRALVVRSLGGVEAAKLVRAGEAVDIVLLASGPMEKLEAEGRLVAGSRTAFARSDIALAVPSSRPAPDVSTEAAVREAVSSATRLCYSTGPSGDHLMRLLERWGLAAGMADRLLQAPPGVPVGSLVAKGDADLGFQQYSELVNIPGITVIGGLPAAVQSTTVFTAGVAAASPDADGARAVIAVLVSSEADPVKRRHGMEPA